MKTLKRISQLFFLTWAVVLSVGKKFNLSWGENGHGICPMGGIETIHTYLTTGKFVKETGSNNLVMLGALLVTLVVGGAFFCGWICPWGTLQEFVSKLGKKFNRFFEKIPANIDKFLRNFRYVVLALILVQTANFFKLVFEGYDPFYTLTVIGGSGVSEAGYLILIAALLLSFFTERAFCKYGCPLGAINGIFNRFSFFKIKRNEPLCIGCKKCDRACPMSIKVSEASAVDNTSCNRCLECVKSCPINSSEKNVLNIVGPDKSADKSKIFPKVMIAAFAIPLVVGILLGGFEEEKIRNFASPDDIRGSYSIIEITENYNISKDELYHIYDLKNNYNPELKIKELGNTGITIDNIRNLILNLDKKPSEISGDYNFAGLDGSKTLREQLKSTQPGKLGKVFVLSSESKVVTVKRSAMLYEVKEIVKNYEEFLNHFGISSDEQPNTSISDLEKKYGVTFKAVKDYIAQNQK